MCLSLFSLLGGAQAADWPQWRGPARNGISKENGWLTRWPASGPKRLWTIEVGAGHSSVAVVGARVYTMGNVKNQDIVWCLNAATGKALWKYAYRCKPDNYAGTRATPTVQENRVYTLSREGLALCLEAGTGRKIWQRLLPVLTGSPIPKWGFSSSPLIEGNLAIYNVGAAGVALDKKTGTLIWKSAPGLASYASPVAYTVKGRRVLAIFPASGLVGVNPANGRQLWSFPWAWNNPYQVNAADPIFWGDTIFISSGYNRGCVLLKIGDGAPTVVYQNTHMRNHINTCVLLNGFLYGCDQSTLKCLEIKTGRERWQESGFGRGGFSLVGDKLVLLTERGELVIAQATPQRYIELARVKVLMGTCYTQPVLSNNRIFCRNRDGQLACFDVRSNSDS